MQPFPSPPTPRPPGRGGWIVAVAILSSLLLVVSTIAIVEYVQLRDARERISDLERADGGAPVEEEEEDDDGGPFGEFGDLLEDLFEGSGDLGVGALDCIEAAPSVEDGGDDIEELSETVEELRGLEFETPVEAEFLSDEETAARVQDLLLEEYTSELADVEQRVLSALGAIPPGTDLRSLRSSALGEQVAGFYEPETGELVIRQSGGEVSVADRVTLAHELDHALTDQVLDIPLPNDPQAGNEDGDLAALALVEGDATLVMQQYSTSLPFDEQFELLDPEALAEAQAGLESMPAYLQQELLFPYEEGLRFVCELYEAGGWEAVNGAYRSPPASTDQILFPERYAAGEQPADPRDPSSPPGPWRQAGTHEIGAANLLWLFSAPGGDEGRAIETPRAAAGAWGGGELQLWTSGTDTALGISLVERPDEERLCLAVQEWYGSSFEGDSETEAQGGAFEADGDRQDAVVTCTPDEVRVGIAPDLQTARALVG